MKSVASQEYWDNHWSNTNFGIASDCHPVRKWIETKLSVKKGGSCLEIGCYPGKFLSVFGNSGYELHGIDLFNRTDLMSEWLSNQGYKVGIFYKIDFLNFKTTNSYDVVCSFGFIEHFKNWAEVVDAHIKLTKKDGMTIVEVPNLKSPLYYFLYKLLEPKVLENHEITAMDLSAIHNIFKKRSCNVQSAQYIGHFYFRFVTKHNNYSKLIANIINFFGPIFNLLPKSVSARYIGVIAIRR